MSTPDPAVATDVRAWFETYQGPGLGRPTGAEEVTPAPDGRLVAFVAVTVAEVHGRPYRRVHLLDPGTGALTAVGDGEADHCPQWSPDGAHLAYVGGVGADEPGQPVIVDRTGSAAGTPVEAVDGVAEYLAWSPDGSSLLVGVAAAGADVAGGHGSGTLPGRPADGDVPVEVETGSPEQGRRFLVCVDPRTGRSRPASPPGLTIWEASWCGDREVLAVVSERADEGGWYGALLAAFALDDDGPGAARTVLSSEDQLGLPACSPDGRYRSVVAAVASDRGFVQGDLLLLHDGGGAHRVDTGGVDVTDVVWCGPDRLVFTGLRGLDCVAGRFDAGSGTVTELFATPEGLGGTDLPRARPAADGTLYSVLDSHSRPPAIVAVAVAGGTARELLSLSHPGIEALGLPTWRVEPRRWAAPDGLEIQGVLALPPGPGPFPLLLHVHGGPVAAFRDRWLMRTPYLAILLGRGYAVLQANPRGSSGRGVEFARLVKGDMNGADTADLLAGVDALVADGTADPDRLGVLGGSYGGNMTAWLVTQDDRFAAAVPCFPHTDYVGFHFSSNIPEFDRLFLDSDPLDPQGRHVTRSAFRYADRVRTPVLQVVGGRDRCCPPDQAVVFHRALVAAGAESVMVTYPQEGHGIRGGPALLDSSTRIVDWFERHLGRRPQGRPPGPADHPTE